MLGVRGVHTLKVAVEDGSRTSPSMLHCLASVSYIVTWEIGYKMPPICSTPIHAALPSRLSPSKIPSRFSEVVWVADRQKPLNGHWFHLLAQNHLLYLNSFPVVRQSTICRMQNALTLVVTRRERSFNRWRIVFFCEPSSDRCNNASSGGPLSNAS